MANLIIPFPEGTRTVVLHGKCITIGRLPENVIQIRDRTISAHHAELILEDGHYRIHDVDSTNGILINGRQVVDFHLLEPCVIQIGNLDCQFALEDPAPAAADEIDPLPGRGEVTAVRKDNQQLKASVTTLREQVETMAAARVGGEDAWRDRLDKLSAELAALKQENHRRVAEFETLKDNLAVMRRDRENLQRAYDSLNAGLPPKPATKPLATPVATPVAAGAPLSMPPRLPKPPVSLGAVVAPAQPSVPTTPSRRVASAIQMPPNRGNPPAVPELAATGPKGTQKLVE